MRRAVHVLIDEYNWYAGRSDVPLTMDEPDI
jgi:hypothetical protein